MFIHSSLKPSEPFPSPSAFTKNVPASNQENVESYKDCLWQSHRQNHSFMSVVSSDVLTTDAVRARSDGDLRSRNLSRSTLGNLPNGAFNIYPYAEAFLDYNEPPSRHISSSPEQEQEIDVVSSRDDDHPITIPIAEPVERDRLFSVIEPEKVDHRPSHPFRRWVNTFHQRLVDRKDSLQSRLERWSLDDFDESPDYDTTPTGYEGSAVHKQSISWPSSAFVTAVRSARMSFSTISPAAQSRSENRAFAHASNESNRQSHSFDSTSTDGSSVHTRIIDEASKRRAVKRRQTIEELVSTEESYVADLKAFVNVFRLRLPLTTR